MKKILIFKYSTRVCVHNIEDKIDEIYKRNPNYKFHQMHIHLDKDGFEVTNIVFKLDEKKYEKEYMRSMEIERVKLRNEDSERLMNLYKDNGLI